MKRRQFLNRTVLTASATLALGSDLKANGQALKSTTGKPFKMNYGPHDGMFANQVGKDFVDQIKFMYDLGFRSIEDNGMLKRTKEEQEKIGSTLS